MPRNGYDIFVSYAHVDNARLPGIEAGWVSTFVDGLRIVLAQELGRRDAYSLWMDYELRGYKPLTPAIHQHLSAAKILILFLSKGYLASRWCREELETFAAGLGRDTHYIFPVYVSPVDEIPGPLKDLSMYRFWVQDHDGPRILADPQPVPTEREYYKGIRRLARDLAEALQDITASTSTTEGFTVFLNGGEQDMELLRTTAARLEERGCGYMLPLSAIEPADGRSPISAEAITRDLRENLESCDAVLLLYRDGPSSQVRQYIKEYRKHRARGAEVPEHIHLCQAQPEPGDLGIHIPELHVVCADKACMEECVERFVGESVVRAL